MLPLSFQVPASVVLLAGGVIACFGGFRLFRFVLGVYGFIIGALIGSSMMGTGDAWMTLAAAAAGGVVGAVVFVAGYFVGVAIIGAGVAALVVNALWIRGDPHPVALVIAAAIGAYAAMSFQRHVIIVGTAFGGAWTMLVGAVALMAGKSARAASAAGDIWPVYPGNAGFDSVWVDGAWVVISLVGVYVQLRSSSTTGKKKRRDKRD
jgi:hypothetical protein